MENHHQRGTVKVTANKFLEGSDLLFFLTAAQLTKKSSSPFPALLESKK